MKVVPDTMIWLSYCTLKDSFRYRLIKEARRQRVRLFVSSYILKELCETLVEDLGQTARYADLARRAVLRVAKIVVLSGKARRHVPGDAGDDPIVQTALLAKADYLVTADKKILEVAKVQDLEIITAAQFGEKLGLQ